MKKMTISEIKKSSNEEIRKFLPIINMMERILNEFAPLLNGEDVFTIDTEISLGHGDRTDDYTSYRYICLDYFRGTVRLDYFDDNFLIENHLEWESLEDAAMDAARHHIYNELDCINNIIYIDRRYIFIIKDSRLVYNGYKNKNDIPLNLLLSADTVIEGVMTEEEWINYSSALSEYLSSKEDKYKDIIDFYESKNSMIKYKVKEDS